MSIQTGDNKFGVAKWIVDPISGLGTHTTIGDALTSAVSGETIFIRPGTYTENLTLKAGVNLVSFDTDGQNGNVTIIGTLTATFTGSCALSGLRLQTNSAPCLTVSGANSTNIRAEQCFFNITNNDGILFSSSNSSSLISLLRCDGDLTSSGIKLFDMTSVGELYMEYCVFFNTGNSTTTSTSSAGNLRLFYSNIDSPLETSGSNTLIGVGLILSNTNLNTTMLTAGGSSAALNFPSFSCGTAPCISVSTTINLRGGSYLSNNANLVVGAGTCLYAGVIQELGTALINAGTNTGGRVYTGSVSFDEGNTLLNHYSEGSWTPSLEFGGGTTGITYSSQIGSYTRIGRVVYWQFDFILTSKGSSVGAATINGLPFTSFATQEGPTASVRYANLTYIASRDHVVASVLSSSSAITLLMNGDNVGGSLLTDVQFANNTNMQAQGFYFT